MSDGGSKSQETPEAAHAKPRPEITFNLEAISKLAAFGTVLAYAVGLVVVNTYLFRLGVSEFDLFRTRFIATGLLVVTIVLVATAGLASAIG